MWFTERVDLQKNEKYLIPIQKAGSTGWFQQPIDPTDGF